MLFWKNGMFKVGPEVRPTREPERIPWLTCAECGSTPRPGFLSQRRPTDRHRRKPLVSHSEPHVNELD